MTEPMTRRRLLAATGALGASAIVRPALAADAPASRPASAAEPPKFRLGLVTYNLAADWDLPTLLKVCKNTGVSPVEFRTTHKHGVEPTLNAEQRQTVKKQCADAGVEIWGCGTTCEFQSPDPAVVQKNI